MQIGIQSLFVSATVSDAVDMDHEQRIAKLEKERDNAS